MYVSPINGRHCTICSTALSVHQQVAGDTCDQRSCKQARLRQKVQEELERKAALRKMALACRSEVARNSGIEDPESFTLAILPSNDRPRVNLPGRRRRQFVDRLQGIISQAAAIVYGNGEPDPESHGVAQLPPVDLAPAAERIAGQACATCRGWCCPQGGEHAFIQVSTIRSYMEANPQLRPRHVLDAYLSFIGQRTYKDSCVYHARHGCLLPHDMRSHVCNNWLCSGLGKLLLRIEGVEQPRAFAVASDDESILRTAVVDADGQREEFQYRGPVETGETAVQVGNSGPGCDNDQAMNG